MFPSTLRRIPKTACQALLIGGALLSLRCGRTKPPETAATSPAKGVKYFHVDPATAGTMRGRIIFHGAAPAKTAISMDAEAWCEQAHTGHPVYDQSVIVGRD